MSVHVITFSLGLQILRKTIYLPIFKEKDNSDKKGEKKLIGEREHDNVG